MIPRYALGNWWSRDLDYTGDEILNIVSHFEKNEIPLSVLLLDAGWHKTQLQDGTRISTGYTFNKELFSDPKALIQTLHEKNIHIGNYCSEYFIFARFHIYIKNAIVGGYYKMAG